MKILDKIFDKKKFFLQIWIIFMCFSAFSLAATFSDLPDKSQVKDVILWDCVTLIPFAIISLFVCVYIIKNKCYKNIPMFLKENKWIILVLIINAIVRLYQLNVFPRWDTEAYLSSLINVCKKFDFTITGYLQCFRLCSHSSLGYAMFLATGNYIVNDSLFGISIINLILVEFGAVFLYNILKEMFPDYKKYVIAFATMLAFFEPMFLGTFYNVSLDFGVAIFALYIMYFAFRKQYLLFFFFSCILVQTKEIGVVVLFGFLIGYAIMLFINGKGSIINRFLDLFVDKVLISAYFGCLMMVFYKIWTNLSTSVSMWGGSMINTDTKKTVNYFGFDSSYINQKLKTIFVLNFYWLMCLIIIMILIFCICKRRRIFSFARKNMEVISGVVSAIFLMGFNCMYITYNNPRYNIWIQLMLSIVLVICLLAVYKNIKKIVSVVSIVLAVLFLVESYTTIDPITYKVFDNIYTSDNTKIVHTGWDEIVSMPADITLYNSQNRYLDITFDEILEQEKYDEDTDVLLIGKFENYDEYENMKTCYFDGKFFDFTWDKKECKRQYVANDNSIPLNILYQSDFEKKLQNGELNDKAILIIAKQFNNHENEILNYANSFYNIGERKEKKIKNQGSLYYYILERRN